MFSLVLSAVLSAQFLSDGPAGRWTASTPRLAAELLPPELAADAVSHVFGRDPHIVSRPIDSVRFDGRVRRSNGGICSRKSYHVRFFRESEGGGVEPTSRYTSDRVRLGGCEGTFAHLNSGSLEDGKRVLRWVKWAVQTAKSKKPLPFAASCSDEIPSDEDRCAAGTRAVLAALPLDKVTIIERRFPRPHRWNMSANETAPASGFWDVDFNATPGGASVALVWKPFPVF